MSGKTAIAIFDIGKTNKKLLVFDEQYQLLHEEWSPFEEIHDEDGDPCEDIEALTSWVKQSISSLVTSKAFKVKALNFSTYGASFVHLDREGRRAAPLYNYLKPFPADLKKQFYPRYGGEHKFSVETASPLLGNLNSGLQLYFLKEKKPALFKQIHVSLHLPQYMSYLVTGRLCSDITSIGCHTALWNFSANRYHEWLYREGVAEKLAPIFPSDQLMQASWNGYALQCGAGLHDSSAALIPYLSGFKEPFVLLSTGTWCISLNPFNQTPLSAGELDQDCLCYMEYRGKPIKASRLFAGYEHEQQVKRLAAYFHTAEDFYKTVVFDRNKLSGVPAVPPLTQTAKPLLQESAFGSRELQSFKDYNSAYHQLIMDIVAMQVKSLQLVMKGGEVKKIFVDGGFGRNPIFMHLLAAAFPHLQVYAASLAQASSIGAALAVHPYWNKRAVPTDLIALKLYADIEAIEL